MNTNKILQKTVSTNNMIFTLCGLPLSPLLSPHLAFRLRPGL